MPTHHIYVRILLKLTTMTIDETSLGVDRVKPWNSMRINLGLGC